MDIKLFTTMKVWVKKVKTSSSRQADYTRKRETRGVGMDLNVSKCHMKGLRCASKCLQCRLMRLHETEAENNQQKHKRPNKATCLDPLPPSPKKESGSCSGHNLNTAASKRYPIANQLCIMDGCTDDHDISTLKPWGFHTNLKHTDGHKTGIDRPKS